MIHSRHVTASRGILMTLVVAIVMAGWMTPCALAQSEASVVLPADDPLWLAARPLLSLGGALDRPWTVGGGTENDFRRMIGQLPRSAVRARLEALAAAAMTDPGNSDTIWGIRLRAAATGTAQEGTDPWRRPALHEPDIYQLVQYESFVRLGRWSAGFGWRHDGMYERDPEALDAALRWSIRSENTYVRYDGTWVGASFGRSIQHWGAPELPGLLLSDNPRPMDHVAFRFGTPDLSVRSSINELDSITSDGRFTGLAGDDSVRVGSERRFLAAHRLDVRLSSAWAVALLHSTLYSGVGSGFSFKFANPFNVALFTVDNRPKNDENNGFLGAEVRHATDRRAAMLQFMVDDLDILNGTEPASVAVTAMFEQHLGAASWISVSGLAVSARAYKTFQPEGTYVYLLRGIGPQDADIVHVQARLGRTWTPERGLVHSVAGVDVRWQGAADILDPFPAGDEPGILTGNTDQLVRPHVRVQAFLLNGWYGTVDAGVLTDGDSMEPSGQVTLGYSMKWSGTLR